MAKSQVSCRRTIPRPAEDVWRCLSGFDISWHPFIARCDLLRSADGALVRVFEDQEGQKYEERRTYLSETDQVLAYQMLSGIDGAHHYVARVQVSDADHGCHVTWSAEIGAKAERIDAIAGGTRDVFETALDALQNGATAPAVRRARRDPLPGGAEADELWPETFGDTPRLNILRGREGTPAETIVLCLHGIGGQASNWTQQLRVLSSLYPIAALNLRGYGGSTLGFEPTQVDDYCADIREVMAHLGAQRVVLVGLSYGSWIATSFAMRHADLLAGLVLAGGCTGMSEAGPEERENFRVSREVPMDAGQTPADFAPAVVDVIEGPHASDAQRAELRASMEAIPSSTYRDALNCFCNPLEQFDFSRIGCPVLLFTGAHDRLAPPDEIRRVSERISDARTDADVQFEIIQGAGHVCNVEAPDAVTALLHRFLARLPGVALNYKSTPLEKQHAKRERIRRAAHDEFCENGYDGASMDRIAKRADVSKPTLYQYFGDKDGLLEAVLDAGRSTIVAPLMEGDGVLVDRLWRFAWGYADFVLRPDMLSLARLILGEASRRPETAVAYHQNGPGRAFEGLVDFVSEAMTQGELQAGPADLMAQNLWSLILSGPRDYYLHHVQERPSRDELHRVIVHGLEVFLKAYGAAPSAQLARLQELG